MESSDPGASGKGGGQNSKKARVESGGHAKGDESVVESNPNRKDENPSTEWDENEDEEIKPSEPPIPQAPSKEEWIQRQITHGPMWVRLGPTWGQLGPT